MTGFVPRPFIEGAIIYALECPGCGVWNCAPFTDAPHAYGVAKFGGGYFGMTCCGCREFVRFGGGQLRPAAIDAAEDWRMLERLARSAPRGVFDARPLLAGLRDPALDRRVQAAKGVPAATADLTDPPGGGNNAESN